MQEEEEESNEYDERRDFRNKPPQSNRFSRLEPFKKFHINSVRKKSVVNKPRHLLFSSGGLKTHSYFIKKEITGTQIFWNK